MKSIKIISLLMVLVIIVSTMISCQSSNSKSDETKDNLNKDKIIGSWRCETSDGNSVTYEFFENGNFKTYSFISPYKYRFFEETGEYSISGYNIKLKFSDKELSFTYYDSSNKGPYLKNENGYDFYKL